MKTTWSPWESADSGDSYEQRYITAIELDGVVYRANPDGGMCAPDGRIFSNAGRGEVRDTGDPTSAYAVYAQDGVETDGDHRLDAETECARALFSDLTLRLDMSY